MAHRWCRSGREVSRGRCRASRDAQRADRWTSPPRAALDLVPSRQHVAGEGVGELLELCFVRSSVLPAPRECIEEEVCELVEDPEEGGVPGAGALGDYHAGAGRLERVRRHPLGSRYVRDDKVDSAPEEGAEVEHRIIAFAAP